MSEENQPRDYDQSMEDLAKEADLFIAKVLQPTSASPAVLERGFPRVGVFRFRARFGGGEEETLYTIAGDCTPVYASTYGLTSGMEALAGFCVDMDLWLKHRAVVRAFTNTIPFFTRGNFAKILYNDANRERVQSRSKFVKENLLLHSLEKPSSWRDNSQRLCDLWDAMFQQDPWPAVKDFRKLLIPAEHLDIAWARLRKGTSRAFGMQRSIAFEAKMGCHAHRALLLPRICQLGGVFLRSPQGRRYPHEPLDDSWKLPAILRGR